MAATNSKTGIANLALIHLGQPTINNIDTPGNSHGASTMALVYDDARQMTLRAGAWRFALRRDRISRDSATPTHSWAYQFTLPTNCMLLHQVGEDSEPLEVNESYKIEGRKIITDEEGPLAIVYVDDISDVSQFPSDFKFAMAAYLAHLGAPDILKSSEKAAEMLKLYEYYMEMAANNNALENPPRKRSRSRWLQAQRNLGPRRIY
ncbi:hypothetical protein UFOVP315_3 [uncultured Caudovirales phage]|uniref:Uncharacterized protein n=1 Tax=uncultured Caudovirales phage TaxID=2100421 RepID=A0A6J5LV06_9CAUD|nr:hypothetical protein UFOVP315_3 [uncultured Caudovirales phage]